MSGDLVLAKVAAIVGSMLTGAHPVTPDQVDFLKTNAGPVLEAVMDQLCDPRHPNYPKAELIDAAVIATRSAAGASSNTSLQQQDERFRTAMDNLGVALLDAAKATPYTQQVVAKAGADVAAASGVTNQMQAAIDRAAEANRPVDLWMAIDKTGQAACRNKSGMATAFEQSVQGVDSARVAQEINAATTIVGNSIAQQRIMILGR